MIFKNNRYIEKILRNNIDLFDEKQKLDIRQVNWNIENDIAPLAVYGKAGIFSPYQGLFLLKRDNGKYGLFAPRTKKDDSPTHIYEITDIEKFIETFRVNSLVSNEFPKDMLIDILKELSSHPAIGFVEIYEKDFAVYELNK
jgi:hypothetical protein